ncbi:hypothetical protein [Helicobacter bilis]|nr:hypothetical protein [Helicobacter bilis]
MTILKFTLLQTINMQDKTRSETYPVCVPPPPHFYKIDIEIY